MGLSESHPAIQDAIRKGLIPAPPAAESDQVGGLAAASFAHCGDVSQFAVGVEFVVGLATKCEANGRSWQGRSRRTGEARRALSRTLGRHLRALAPLAEHYHAGGPLDVVLTRLGGKLLDRTVNLPSALKAAEDAVALMLGADDGDPRWRCHCEQEPGGPVGVRVRITKGE
jgi:hypothetical protein